MTCFKKDINMSHYDNLIEKDDQPLSYNIGSSNYAQMTIQPWEVWEAWNLNPWEADVVKRIARTKKIEGKSELESKLEDWQKIEHIAKFMINKLNKEVNK